MSLPGVTLPQLVVLGHITKFRHKDGWYRDGSKFLASRTNLDVVLIRASILELVNIGWLQAERLDGRIIGVRITEKANSHRIHLNNLMFPDIKEMNKKIALMNSV